MIVTLYAAQALSVGVLGQRSHDDAAARIAASMHGNLRPHTSVATDSHTVTGSDRRLQGWRPVTNEDLRRRSSHHAPKGYRFRRAATVDFDHDGRADVVEMVERSGRMALRIAYGSGGPKVLANIRDGRWTDQGLFAAGDDAVMVNFPESGAYFLFQRGRQLRIQYGDD